MNQTERPDHDGVPPEETFVSLDDDALWAIVHRQLSAGDVTRLVWLLEENADNALNSSERAELQARLAEAGQMERESDHAAALLRQRGRHVPPLGE
jgi:hypothetical protein